MNRRGFLGTILATASAPAIVRASSIMRIAPALKISFACVTDPMLAEVDRILTEMWGPFSIKPQHVIVSPAVHRYIERLAA